MKRLSILPFQTQNKGKYIFDSNTSTVIPVNSIMEKVITLYENNSIDKIHEILSNDFQSDELQGVLRFVDRWNKTYRGFYRTEEMNEEIKAQIDYASEKDIIDLLNSGLMFQLTLNVTEDCNLRCRYCFFSDDYKYTRTYAANHMSYETAVKSLDYFFEFMSTISKRVPAKKAAVSFYGGEPLINVSLIRQVVEYANSKSPVPLIYNITTNTILLNDDTIKFLVENDFNVSISFDGTKENHDRNRVLTNKKGTYDIVLKNIERFRELYPDYKKVTLISVYDWQTNLIENDNFFEENDLPPIVFLSGVAKCNTDYYNQFTEVDKQTIINQMNYLTEKYIDYRKTGKTPSMYLRALFDGYILTSVICRARQMDMLPKMLPFTASCVPGMKISVRTDGIFDICERVNSTMPTGSIDIGLDYAKIMEITKKYNDAIFKNCYHCPIRNNCALCYAQCMEESDFKLPSNNCSDMIKTYREAFSYAYSIFEARPEIPLKDYIDQPVRFLSLLYS